MKWCSSQKLVMNASFSFKFSILILFQRDPERGFSDQASDSDHPAGDWEVAALEVYSVPDQELCSWKMNIWFKLFFLHSNYFPWLHLNKYFFWLLFTSFWFSHFEIPSHMWHLAEFKRISRWRVQLISHCRNLSYHWKELMVKVMVINYQRRNAK